MDISLDDVKRRLAESKGEWPKVSRGSGVDYFTIVRIANGTSKNPWFATIEKLANYYSREDQTTRAAQ